jgi:hypothetical protein
MLGELGAVLPRVAHGTPSRPAQGWYAELHAGPRAGEEVFLGDYGMLAGMAIARLLKEAAGAEPKRRTRKAASRA